MIRSVATKRDGARHRGDIAPQPDVAIYEGTVRHRRRGPQAREFLVKLFLAYLDVDRLPDSLDRLPLWSARRGAPVWFRRRDFLDKSDQPLGPAVRSLVERRLGRSPEGPIYLLAHLRTFGWLFNPLSVYYCFRPDGINLDVIVLEVTNTPWGERHWYVVDARSNMHYATTPKAMHVSPFLPMDLDYGIRWTPPQTELTLEIEATRAGEVVFDAALRLRRVALDRRVAITALGRYPLLPQRVSAGIYAHAARLSFLRAPIFRHPTQRSEPAP